LPHISKRKFNTALSKKPVEKVLGETEYSGIRRPMRAKKE
jgi:hypothetical protein